MPNSESLLPSTVFIELRRRLIIPLITFILAFCVGIIFNKQILLFILSLFNLNGINVVLTSSYQIFEIAFNIGCALGIFCLIPVFLYQLYSFTKPALAIKEKNLIRKVIPLSIILFLTGFSLGVKMTQYIFTFFSESTAGIKIGNYLDVSKVISQVLIMGILTGIVFQIPLIFTALIKMKIISKNTLVKKRKIVWTVLLIIAVFLPSTDLFSLSLLTIPLLLLFEVTLLLNR